MAVALQYAALSRKQRHLRWNRSALSPRARGDRPDCHRDCLRKSLRFASRFGAASKLEKIATFASFAVLHFAADQLHRRDVNAGDCKSYPRLKYVSDLKSRICLCSVQ